MERLVATCSEYTNINKYVFISCRNYIIVLEKLHDTITNESKLSDISNPLYAKYRANKLRVILIINKFEPFDIITEIQEDSIMKYETDKIVEVDDYDMDLDQVFTTGIHYFNTIEQAFYWKIIDFNPTYTGKYMCWYHNGNKRYDGEYLDGKIAGKMIHWWPNGNRREEAEYLDGKMAKWIYWFPNSNKQFYREYVDGKITKWITWYENGDKYAEGESLSII